MFEVISAVLHEITWHGLPENRDKRMEDLKKQIKQIEEDEKSGKIREYKTYSKVSFSNMSINNE